MRLTFLRTLIIIWERTFFHSYVCIFSFISFYNKRIWCYLIHMHSHNGNFSSNTWYSEGMKKIIGYQQHNHMNFDIFCRQKSFIISGSLNALYIIHVRMLSSICFINISLSSFGELFVGWIFIYCIGSRKKSRRYIFQTIFCRSKRKRINENIWLLMFSNVIMIFALSAQR